MPLAGHGKVPHTWKLWIAGATIAALTCLGLYFAITRWHEGWEYALMLLGGFVGPAVAAAFGYFWCLPEVLGGACRDEERTLLQKWSDYALLCSFIGILLVEGSYLRVIWVNFGYLSWPRALALLIASPWVLAACVAASKEYLSWTVPGAAGGSRTGWRARVRIGMELWGSWLVRSLTTSFRLLAGGVLVLLSLVLVVSGDIFGPEYKGYEVALGANAGTHFGTPFVTLLVAWMQQGSYLFGILLAVLALVGVLARQAGRRIRRSGILAAFAGILSLREVTELAVTWHQQNAPVVLAVLWLAIWVVPVITWLMSKRSDAGGWNHTRVAILVFYLPIFLLWLGFLPFVSYLAIGYGAFMAGMLLLWSGFLQGGREIEEQSS